MWHPTRLQSAIIWVVTIVVVTAWPPSHGQSLAVKVVRWAADPLATLPTRPLPLPPGLDDDGDAVTAHDLAEQDYALVAQRSAWTRWRLAAKEMGEPFDPGTEQRGLLLIVALAALIVWRLNGTGPGPAGA